MSSETQSPKRGAATETPPMLAPEAVVAQLRALRQQIAEVTPLTQQQRKALRHHAEVPNDVVQACINAIEHGNQFNELLGVVVTLSMGEESLEVKIRDEGTGVKGEVHVPDIDRKMHGEENPRGMGMFLIQSLVDEAEWVKGSPGKGSYVRLVIRLAKESE